MSCDITMEEKTPSTTITILMGLFSPASEHFTVNATDTFEKFSTLTVDEFPIKLVRVWAEGFKGDRLLVGWDIPLATPSCLSRTGDLGWILH